MEELTIKLSRNPTAGLDCTFVSTSAPPSPRETLIVYLTGIDNPRSVWFPTVSAVLKRKNAPPMLLYNRPGQGRAGDRNPDGPGRPKGHGRDCLDAAHDLREMIVQIANIKLGIPERKVDSLRIVFVASSIGCAIVRLYDIHYPGTISALLLLDSTIANSDTVSLFPDPEAAGFSEKELPEGVTIELIRESRRLVGRVYHPDCPNREGLWRGTLPGLLPHSDAPQIKGPKPGLPYITVMEHDREVSPAEAYKIMPFLIRYKMTLLIGCQLLGLSRIMFSKYFDTAWHEYNKGLTRLTGKASSKGPVEAKGCGHLIHRDNPQLVADEIGEILDKLVRNEASRL